MIHHFIKAQQCTIHLKIRTSLVRDLGLHLVGRAADYCRVDDEVGRVLRYTTQQVRHALTNITLGVVQPGKQLRYDTCNQSDKQNLKN